MRLQKGIRLGYRLASLAARRGTQLAKTLAHQKKIDRRTARKLLAEGKRAARAVSQVVDAAAQKQISRLDGKSQRDIAQLRKEAKALQRQLHSTLLVGARVARRLMKRH